MKVIETISTSEKNGLIINDDTPKLFTSIFKTNDIFYNSIDLLANYYYLQHSGQKSVSPLYTNYYDFWKNQNPDFTSDEIKEYIEPYIGSIIRNKYINKWNKVYNLLLSNDYNALDSYVRNEKRTANNKTTITSTGTIEDNGKVGTDETIIRNGLTIDDVYGFNSVSPVNDTQSDEQYTETTKGDADKNTSYNKRDKNNTDTNDYVVDETITKNGRDETGAKLVNEELDLRNTQIFYDILCNDIDSVLALAIYL